MHRIQQLPAALLLAIVAGCAARGGEAPRAPAADLAYEVAVAPNADELSITATFASASIRALRVDDRAARFVRDVEIADGGSWRALAADHGAWNLSLPDPVPPGAAPPRVRYRFQLRAAATALRNPDLALDSHGSIVAPPSTWLLRPVETDGRATLRFEVSHKSGVAFACGFARATESGRDEFIGRATDLDDGPCAIFGAPTMFEVAAPGTQHRVDVAIGAGSRAAGDEAIRRWVERASGAIAEFYGRYPVSPVALIVVVSSGHVVGGGKTAGGSAGASILFELDPKADDHDLRDDWVLTHEMAHLAMPSVARNHHWFEEGTATYVEMLARAQAGFRTPQQFWNELVEGLPRGLPEAGDRGLDRTHSWGRTYWGGALYCFLSDLEIRKSTQQRRSLRDALRAVLNAGGNITEFWNLERVLSVGDEATGTTVLADRYREMARESVRVDLPELWRELGVVRAGASVTFDDSAPLAAVRRSFTEPSGAASSR